MDQIMSHHICYSVPYMNDVAKAAIDTVTVAGVSQTPDESSELSPKATIGPKCYNLTESREQMNRCQ